jgi:16S rRNA G966 N2-methylase RsmD
MVERDRKVLAALEHNAGLLQAEAVEAHCADALEFLRADKAVYDVVFLDPPFRVDCLPAVLAQLPPRLAPGASVYVEAPGAPHLPAGWEAWRASRAGAVHYQLIRWTRHDDQSGLPRYL